MQVIFREVTSLDDKLEMFKIRYLAYKQDSAIAKFMSSSKLSLDVDMFDVNSKFFGIFSDGEALGYGRLIFNNSTIFNKEIFQFGIDNGLWEAEHFYSRKFQYPFLSYPNVPESVYLEYQKYLNKGYTIFEAGRLAANPKFKHLHKIANSIIENGISMILAYNIKMPAIAFMNCFSENTQFFEPLGFTIIKHISPYFPYGKSFSRVMNLLALEYIGPEDTTIPSNLHNTILEKIDLFSKNSFLKINLHDE